MTSVPLLLRRLRRAVLARRRLLAALCAVAAVLSVVRASAAPPTPTTSVLTAAHDLPAGVVVGRGDVRRVAFEPDSVPQGALDAPAVVGRTTAGPVRSGEALTDVRLVRASVLSGYPGLSAVPVRIGDPGAVGLLRVGDRVDVLAIDPQGRSEPRWVGRDVPVLAIPRGEERSTDASTGALVVLALPLESARAASAASVTAYLSVVIVG